jgi:MFS transporter, YNFM family, putative membrane transport protein
MSAERTHHRRGDAGFRRASLAMFAAGVSTFALLYAPQPLLPALAHGFGVSPAESSLTLAVSTATLALALLPAGWLSDSWGRTRVMGLSMLAAGGLGLLAAAAPNLEALLVVRALQGAALAGVPAVGMAYLAEEIDRGSLGASIGLYIAGNALGGMAGRLIGGAAAAHGWRIALAAVAVLSLACAAAFFRLAPPSRHHVRSRFARRPALASLTVHLQDRGQLRLDAIGALLMGTFVAVYNAVGFRLEAAPYHLPEAAVAAIFLVYPIGSLASTVAGRLADRFGRRRVLPPGVLIAAAGVAVTALRPLPFVVLGIALLTIGFFAAHSVASSWVGRRAHTAPAQASALYLLAYYAGSSVAGPLGGAAWDAGRWPEVMLLAGVLLGTSLLVALRLRRTPPLVPPAAGRPSAATRAA